ncbi:MAG: hypothetical protein K6L76_05340 [Agarilytica sp.]
MKVSFKKFRDGLIYFTVGFIIIYLARNTLEASLKQELIVLFGLVMIGIGFLMAMLAQTRMVISRILHFFDDTPSSHEK